MPPEAKTQQDFSTLNLVPGGKERIRVSLREAMLIKSVASSEPTNTEIKNILEEDSKESHWVAYRKYYHYKEVHRRRKGVFEIAKQEIIDHIGQSTFTITDPMFREICSWHGYNPSSLAGTLVKYGFMECVGTSRHKTKSNNNSEYRVYRVKTQI